MKDTSSLHFPERLEKLLSPNLTTKELRLRVKNSQVFSKDFVLNISSQGYMSSKTKGVVYFGNKRKNYKGGEKICDFIIPCDGVKQYGQLFVIYYCVESDSYIIRDLGIGPGVYVKLEYSFKLTSDILINIGESHLYFRIVFTENSYPNLLLTVFSAGPPQNYCFYAQEQHISPIRIGRARDCDICLDDMLLSKYQASILYSHSQGWMLIDGNLVRQRPSTNGGWYKLYRLYCSNDTTLDTGMEIKVAQNLFKVQVTS
jgi:hypothetical protein